MRSRDETWCMVNLHLESDCLDKQCDHVTARGSYVVQIRNEWWMFDPDTKLQALSWINKLPERGARIRWLCHGCGKVMPLTSYSDAEYAAGAPRVVT